MKDRTNCLYGKGYLHYTQSCEKKKNEIQSSSCLYVWGEAGSEV